MTHTPNLSIYYMVPAQLQKHVTVNEAFVVLDSVAQCAVLEMSRNDPPANPVEGDRYLLGDSPTGEWAGKPGILVCWLNEGWRYHRPKPGWRMYNLADDTLLVMNKAGAWVPLTGGGSDFQNIPLLGLGGAATSDNPFTAKLNAALWTARGTDEGGTGDLFFKTTRASSSNSVGHLFQTGLATRAMLGQFGSDRFTLKVSPDGTDGSFREAIVADDVTGIVDLPRLPRFKAFTNYDNFGAIDSWTTIGINNADANEQEAFDAGSNRFRAPAAGSYVFGATVMYKEHLAPATRLGARLVLNGATAGGTEIRGSFTELSGAPVSHSTAVTVQTMVILAKDDTVELQGRCAGADGYFAAEQTCFWGYKVG